MRAIVRVFVVGTLGVAALVGSPAVTLALPKFVVGKTYCLCDCQSNQGGKKIGWEKDKACSLSNHKACSITLDGKVVSGELYGCYQCTGYSSTECSGPAGAYRLTNQLELTIAPEAAPPSPIIPPRRVKPPGGTLQK